MKNMPTTEEMVVQALQWTGQNIKAMRKFAGWENFDFVDGKAEVFTNDEWVSVSLGYWVVKQPDGTFKIKGPGTFKSNYTEITS